MLQLGRFITVVKKKKEKTNCSAFLCKGNQLPVLCCRNIYLNIYQRNNGQSYISWVYPLKIHLHKFMLTVAPWKQFNHRKKVQGFTKVLNNVTGYSFLSNKWHTDQVTFHPRLTSSNTHITFPPCSPAWPHPKNIGGTPYNDHVPLSIFSVPFLHCTLPFFVTALLVKDWLRHCPVM